MSDAPHKTLLAQLMPDPGTMAGHTVATGTLLGTLMGYLPTIALVVTIIWYAMTIIEMLVRWYKVLHHKHGRGRLDTHKGHGDN